MTYRVPSSAPASPAQPVVEPAAPNLVPPEARRSGKAIEAKTQSARQRQPRFVYRAVQAKDQPREGSYTFTRSALSAPLLGSRLIFPRRFDAAVARLLERPGGSDIQPGHAFWYFGPALRLWIDPMRLIWRLTDFVEDGGGTRWIGSSFLDAGHWQDATLLVRRSPVHREMSEFVANDLDFRQTRTWRTWKMRAELRKPLMRYGTALTTPERVEAYFRYCADLVESVRAHGVVPRGDVRRLRMPRFRHRGTRSGFVDGAERDIGVAVGPTGMLVRHLGGKHRTAIAQALKLPLVPVEVRMVHVRWLAGEMARLGLPAHKALPAALPGLGDGEARP